MNNFKFSVFVVCREGFLREAIVDAIGHFSTASVASSMHLSDRLHGELEFQPDVILYVDTNLDLRNFERDAVNAHIFKTTNWVVLSDNTDAAVPTNLRETNAKVSFAPLDISRNALVHLIGLSACGHETHVDHCRGALGTHERNRILGTEFSQSQLRLLHYLAAGLSNKEIARKEAATVNAIKVRVRTLLNRLQVANRTQAAVMAAKAGLDQEYSRRQNVVRIIKSEERGRPSDVKHYEYSVAVNT